VSPVIQKILFPVDFSPACAAMAGYVKRAATIFEASVTMVHVCDLASHNGFELYVRSVAEIAEEHQNLALEKLHSFLQSDFPLAECQRIVLAGDAATEITHLANAGAFDLIVMPTHASRFRRMLLGSNTAKVLNDADCPVLTTEHAEFIAPKPLDHREWLCAVALDGDSERLLRIATRAAAAAGARLTLIHAIQTSHPKLSAESSDEEGMDSFAVQEARRRAEILQGAVGSKAEFRILVGPVIKNLLVEGAQRSNADVLLIGRRRQPGAFGRMHDLTYTVVRDSPFPVLSV
jgi:nucleotide-binding universal stress UspA family protein